MKKIFFSILILSFLIVGIGVLAQNDELPPPGITPDSPFYFLKTWKESIQTFFTFGAENKAEQYLHLAEVRLAEYQKMIEKDKTEIAQKTLEKYEKQLNQALEKSQEAKEKGKDVEKLKEEISEKILKHQEVLEGVLEKVPEQVKPGIEKAIEASQKGLDGFGGGGPEILEEPESKEPSPQPLGPTKPKTPIMSDLDIFATAGTPYTISWHDVSPADSKATKYFLERDIISSFSNPTVVYEGSSTKITESFSPTGTTTYYYRVKACNKYGCSSWSNITFVQITIPTPPSPEPKITVTSPNGGETWKAENTYTIQWKSIGLAKVRLNLLSQHKDDSFTYDVTNIASEVDAAQSSYLWHIPAEMPCVSLPCLSLADYPCHKIEVVDSRYGRDSQVTKVISDESDGCFKIEEVCLLPKAPVLTDPGISVKKDENFNVKWPSVSRATKYQVQRDTSLNFSDPYPIPPDSEQNWRTDSPEIAKTYYYRVKACNDCGCGSWSNVVDMQVIVPSINVTSPNGGEKWAVGNTYEITWTAVGVNKVTLRVNYGGGYLGLGATIPSTGVDATLGKFSWQIPSNLPYAPGDNLKVKITDDSNSTIYDESNNYFSIIEGAVGLENIRNQLASVSEVISRLMENVKKLMAGPIGILSGSYGVKVLAQKAVLQTDCGKFECVEKSANFDNKYGPGNWTDAGAECICQYYTPEEWKLTYCALARPTEKELRIWRDCGVPVPGGPLSGSWGWTGKEEGPETVEIIEPADLTQVTFLNYCSDPDWSPDGSQIIFERQKENDRGIYLINADGTGLTKIGPGHNPSWNPVDNGIIYRGEDPWRSLFLIDLDKGWENKVKLVDQINEHGSWSPGGKKIAYDSPFGSKSSSIWVTNSDGSGKTRLTTDEDGYCIGPSFSYDGSKIVYLKGLVSYAVGGGKDELNEIWVMDADGSNKHMIYAPDDSTQLVFQRAWNKNNKILFMRTWYRVKPPQVWMINADGSDPKPVVSGPDVFGDPVWDNTGTKVAISKSPVQPVAPGDIWMFSYEEPTEEEIEKPAEGVEEAPKNIFQKIWETIIDFFKWIFRIK